MISIITWDAAFRESYHTVDFFNCQTLDKNQFEFIWADFYSTISPELNEKVQAMENGRTFCFGGEGKWHLGQCLNAAIRASKGDLIVIPDGDIAVEEDFLEEVTRCHQKTKNLVLYFRRWDEPSSKGNKQSTISGLNDVCQLNVPSNYGGCLTLPKECFEYVSGYEEHELFSEAGANGLELYTRLKNAGFPTMWHPTKKVFHPWHSGSYPNSDEYKIKVDKQNWFIKKRELNVVCKADKMNAALMLKEYISQNSNNKKDFKLLNLLKFCK